MKHKSGSMEVNEWFQRVPVAGERFQAFAEGQKMIAVIRSVRRIRNAAIDQLKQGDGTHLVEFDLRPDIVPARPVPPWMTGENPLNRTGL